MTLIELGEYSPSSPATTVAEPRRRSRARRTRRFLIVALTVLTLLAVTGSARPEPQGVHRRWSIPLDVEDRFTAAGDAVYASDSGRLTAYALADGAVRWSVDMPEPGGWPQVAVSAGVLMLQAERVAHPPVIGVGTQFTQYYAETIALDARTGAELWHDRGSLYGVSGDLALLADWTTDGDRLLGLRAAGLRDGAVRWSLAGLDAAQATTAGDRFVAVRPNGTASVYRLADGVRLTTARLAWQPSTPDAGRFTDLFADRRHVYVRLADARGTILTGYALDGLRELWRAPDAARQTAYACGAVVCGLDGDGFTAYDPDTGAVRWRAGPVQTVWTAGAGWLLAVSATAGAWVLYADTDGRVIARLGAGTLVRDDPPTDVYLLADTYAPPRRAAVRWADLSTGRVVLRGVVDPVGDQGCMAAGGRLVCATTDHRLVISDVRR